jgi:hypothetical protein
MSKMRRREFITLLGGATAAWPLAARAQQPDRLRRIGVLMGIAESDPARPAFLSAFTRALQDLGWRDVSISGSTIAGAPATAIASGASRASWSS